VFGRNKKPSPIANGFFRSFMDEVQSKIWVVAGITALLSALFSGFTEGWKGITNGVALIVFALLVIIIVAFIDFLKDRQFINQQDLLKEESISVIRGKPFSTRSISVWDVVVGDVILIETGNRVPADCMIVESVGLTVDEPGDDMDYGEAIPKSDNLDIFLKAGSIIKTGNAKAIVCAVGKDSTRGVKDEELDTSTKTQLEQKL
jgi:magnesium-transporting ATPase (P-type)